MSDSQCMIKQNPVQMMRSLCSKNFIRIQFLSICVLCTLLLYLLLNFSCLLFVVFFSLLRVCFLLIIILTMIMSPPLLQPTPPLAFWNWHANQSQSSPNQPCEASIPKMESALQQFVFNQDNRICLQHNDSCKHFMVVVTVAVVVVVVAGNKLIKSRLTQLKSTK